MAASTTPTNVDAHLEIIPEHVIEFTLSEQETSPKVTMTLRHPDSESGPVAFKVCLCFGFCALFVVLFERVLLFLLLYWTECVDMPNVWIKVSKCCCIFFTAPLLKKQSIFVSEDEKRNKRS